MDREQLFASIVAACPDRDGFVYLERQGDDYQWAATVDDFAPIRIDHDVSGLLPDPDEPERGLSTADGMAVV